ncbi:unnamed protein product [Penicillium salamii]|uniref:Transcriptional coactivator p15 (PC4) C-terminal domain-containing protein n=1 Tax=Penicillium salamii TaxID=1612424 RepID=A0A9W4JXB8_9EURO|nr:unnamed protein product [Penicillium salamii]CAG8233349.1 unnamed protein product [Penicillium salamii]CAG8255798.1 unnamed protein product [Penicillium salamii]CAG8259695.1 unnamed protein product [Penicillium salamii]CAG8309404.1 unnamed protein product [Penicillium salamii]
MTSRKRASESSPGPESKKAKVSGQTDSNGDRYWELSKMRRVTISSFRGKTQVNIREYYEKDGQQLPGKKGISMPIDQFSALVSLLPEIEGALKQSGETIPRPAYSGESPSGHEESGNQSPTKQNIDATSDEDEGEE